jgi:hypothetical protein
MHEGEADAATLAPNVERERDRDRD